MDWLWGVSAMRRTVFIFSYWTILQRLKAELPNIHKGFVDKEHTMLTLNKTLNFRELFWNEPVGSCLWSGQELADFLEISYSKNNSLRGKKILELGAGLGCAGIVAACLGGDVTVTDLPNTMAYLKYSIDRNRKLIDGTGGNIRAQVLRWGDAEEIKALPKQDVIMMADVLYDKDSMLPLARTVIGVSHESTIVLICQARWSSSESSRDLFFSQMNKHFKFSEFPASGRTLTADTHSSETPLTKDIMLLKGDVLKVG